MSFQGTRVGKKGLSDDLRLGLLEVGASEFGGEADGKGLRVKLTPMLAGMSSAEGEG